MLSDCINDDIPHKMKTLNIVIPILMHFCSFLSSQIEKLQAACHPMKCDVLNDIKVFPIYFCKFLTLSNQTSHYKSKCIRIQYDRSQS